MAGIRQQVQSMARGNGTATLRCAPDVIPAEFGLGITHRWEAYAADAEPTDPGGTGTLTYLQDLIGTAHMVPNAMGLTGGSGASYHVIGNQVAMGFGAPRRLMTPLDRAQPHTIVMLVRPRAEAYTALSVFLGSTSGTPTRGSIYIDGADKWAMSAGNGLTHSSPVKHAQWQIVTAVFNGANSVFRIDGVEEVGNAGTEAADRIVLGSYATLAAPAVAYIAAVYYAPSAWTPAQRANFENWLRATSRLPFS